MKINRLYLFLPIVAILMASCEDVIQLDLKVTSPKLVIDANLNATAGECQVVLTQTVAFYQKDTLLYVKGATVRLTHGGDPAVTLAERSPGTYAIDGIRAMPGQTCLLTVTTADGDLYSARTVVPSDIRLDSLKVQRGFGDPRPTSPPVYQLVPKWMDPAGTADFYRFSLTRNGKTRHGSYNILSDETFNGTETEQPQYRYSLHAGDTVRFEFQSIDSLSYRYYTQVNDMARPSFISATPYNPVGNFDNGALGYFGVYFIDIKDLIVYP